jgi:general stress protein YciG
MVERQCSPDREEMSDAGQRGGQTLTDGLDCAFAGIGHAASDSK